MARFIGTGVDPRYPEGQVVDIPDAEAFHSPSDGNTSQLTLLEKGWVREVEDPAVEDPSYNSPEGIAQAVIRGDNLSDPVDRQIAEDNGFLADDGNIANTGTAAAYDAVHEDPQPDGIGNTGSLESASRPSGKDAAEGEVDASSTSDGGSGEPDGDDASDDPRSVENLKAEAKAKGISGYSNMNKAELVRAVDGE